jgi:hypothetical protein
VLLEFARPWPRRCPLRLKRCVFKWHMSAILKDPPKFPMDQPLTEAWKAHLANLDVAGLEALRLHLKQHRSWPT